MPSLFNRVLLLLFALLTGCENDLDIPSEAMETKLTMNAEVQPDEKMKILIAFSKQPLSNGNFQVPKDAIVNLYKDDEYLETLAYNPNDTTRVYGLYRSNHRPKSGATYRVEVLYPGYDKMIAVDKIPSKMEIDTLKTTYYPADFGQDGEAKFDLTFQDHPEEGFYVLYIFYQTLERTDKTGADSLEYRYYTNARSLNVPGFEEDYSGGLMFSDGTFNGQQTTIQAKLSAEPSSVFASNKYKEVRIFFELRSISRNNYLYRQTYTKYVNFANNGFGEPVLVWSNIQNGFGIFSSFTRDVAVYNVK